MESAESPAPDLRNLETPTAMRLTDHSENPILSTCLAWFGGGGRKGPSKQETQAAKAEQASMQQAAANQAAQQQQQIELARQQAEAQRKAQEEMVRQMEANKPAPAAQVDPGNPQVDVAAEAARRKGMRKSILAGESGQAPMTTGYSTLG
jgi:hypothetical protein